MKVELNQFYVQGNYCACPTSLEQYSDGGGDEYRAYVFHRNANGEWRLIHADISIHANWFSERCTIITDQALIKMFKMLML